MEDKLQWLNDQDVFLKDIDDKTRVYHDKIAKVDMELDAVDPYQGDMSLLHENIKVNLKSLQLFVFYET